MRSLKYYLSIILFVSASTVGTSAITYADAPGNNGTIKIHEQGTPSGAESNDPAVCVFNVEGFGFDVDQAGYLQFDVQGGDGPKGVAAGPYSFGPTSSTGYYASQYFTLQAGHYKATLYGKQLPSGQLKDEKAKSKVFKVTCASSPTLTTTTPTPGRGGGQVLGATTAAATDLPATQQPELTDTGAPVLVTTLLALAIISAACGVKFYQRRRPDMPTVIVTPQAG